ncbi:3-dehydroquinate synthase [Gammaproteobacteria bacterium]|nr:3-dehydroquinate synthase [Gammaproteobacteria bacterium]
MNKIHVNLKNDSYNIYVGDIFGAHIFKQIEELQINLTERQILIITNSTVAALYLKDTQQLIQAVYPHARVSVLELGDGEQYKNFDSINAILSHMLEHQFNRSSLLVALGGGVIGDMTGFAASIYQRGIDYISIPTTLLAQVDSSVGGKTGINHALGKNMIGAFKQPKLVLINPNVLKTLTDLDFSSGMAEVVKYGLIMDLDFYNYLAHNVAAINLRDLAVLQRMIIKSIQNKVALVEIDEFETGNRALLNLGHTFGHALEKIQQYAGLTHGQGVAIGTVMAARLSSKLGYLSLDCVNNIKNLLSSFKLPVAAPADINVTDMINAMSLDKKNINGTLRLILLEDIAKGIILESVDITTIKNIMVESGVNA